MKRHTDPVGAVLATLRLILFAVIAILFVLVVGKARAANPGDIAVSTVVACDSKEDAVAFFTSVIDKQLPVDNSCGTIREAIMIYVSKVETVSIRKGTLHIHEVTIANVPGNPTQYVASFTPGINI